MSDERSQAYSQLVVELSRRLLAGEIVVGQVIELEGSAFRIDGFDPFGADGRCVYVRAPNGEQVTIQVPAG